jgi:hypothetical protein
MKKTKKILVPGLVVMATILSQSVIMHSANAEIFKCTNKQGKVYYNDKPCPVESDEEKIQNEKDPSSGYAPSDSKLQKNQLKDSNMLKKKAQKSSFYKPEHKDTDEKTEPEDSDDFSGSGHRGTMADPATRERIPVFQFQNENKKVKDTRTESHPEPKLTRKPGGKLSVNDKKALLGITSEPE